MVTVDNSSKPSNDNVHTTNACVIRAFRDIKNGKGKGYWNLAAIYEKGSGVEPDMDNALSCYEKYYEAYKKIVPADFDVVAFLIDVANKFKTQKNKAKAEEYYLNAYMHIVEACKNDGKKKARLVKKYKLEELIKELN